eukprot:CAMPEP_0116845468 /NCGR_PEP_ID=MMETSP0418-20121206/13283_1 /TAXON_ID=1158023 /ORGANISM="Astrosyne radiata, Strain 13vi08-1A" /LENGTH=133 /DNA_ID=CAMNT_0004476581 /DNA_START=45 /DNA_END=446 /DNA_ORIENTATION=-
MTTAAVMAAAAVQALYNRQHPLSNGFPQGVANVEAEEDDDDEEEDSLEEDDEDDDEDDDDEINVSSIESDPNDECMVVHERRKRRPNAAATASSSTSNDVPKEIFIRLPKKRTRLEKEQPREDVVSKRPRCTR